MVELPHFKPLAAAKRRVPDRVLLIATRQIGDVLLATPLLRSLRRAWPETTIDVLVYARKGHMLEGNPDLDEMIEIEEHPDRGQYWQLLRRIFRRYNLAVSTLAGDRPNIYGLFAAPQRVGLVPDLRSQNLWKRWTNQGWVLLDNVYTHTVEQNLMLARVLGIEPLRRVVPPRAVAGASRLGEVLGFDPALQPFAVIHPFPMWHYKRWTQAGWESVMDVLIQRGLRVVITGGPEAEERAFCRELASGYSDEVMDVSARFSFGELSLLLARARCFIGPDTAMTHLAAANGIPTLALYGPSNPVKWGPWPKDHDSETPPFSMVSSEYQRQGNVLLLQPHYEQDCVPCREEGCDRHKASFSACLQEMPAARVIDALDQLLA